MNKTIHVEGMTCGHCKMKVEEALNALEEVSIAEVDLIEGIVAIDLASELTDQRIAEVLKEAGYAVTSDT